MLAALSAVGLGLALFAPTASSGAPVSPDAPRSAATSRAATTVPKPTIVPRPIPLTAQRKRDTVAYAQRHYGLTTSTIVPRTIVQHWTANDSVSATWNTFASNAADPELGERPGTCAQFVIGRDGTIFQLTPIAFLCRHTVGLNWAAIGIEHVGRSDGQVLGTAVQMRASIRLTRWLRCRSSIPVDKVIGHAESLSSPFHRERVQRLRKQTHGDFQPAAMKRYRTRLRAAGGC
ncbi:MAG: peptidoglycan recognition family protein [Patulibacter sp.]